jgi:tetratricopeptide (TPR) repeat protein
MVRMAAAESAAGLPPALRAEWLRGLLADPVRSVRLAAARSLAGVELPPDRDAADLARALDELRDAASRNADRPEAHLDLAILATRQGDLDVARREAELALAIDPGLVPAAVNLADALRASGRDDLAESVLRDASKRNPESPDLHYALGLLHVRRGRPEAAHAALARAADLADDGRFAYPLGLLLVEEERTDEGLRVLADALAQRPGDRQLLVALATLHREASANCALYDLSGSSQGVPVAVHLAGDVICRQLHGLISSFHEPARGDRVGPNDELFDPDRCGEVTELRSILDRDERGSHRRRDDTGVQSLPDDDVG